MSDKNKNVGYYHHNYDIGLYYQSLGYISNIDNTFITMTEMFVVKKNMDFCYILLKIQNL